MGILQNGKSNSKYQTIGAYVPDSVLSSFWVQSKIEVGNSVAGTLLRYKPHWRKAENAFEHYRWEEMAWGAKKDISPEPLLLVLSMEQPVCPAHVTAALSVLTMTHMGSSKLTLCNGRTRLGSLSPPFSCFQVRFLVIPPWWDTIAGLRGTHMHILPCLIRCAVVKPGSPRSSSFPASHHLPRAAEASCLKLSIFCKTGEVCREAGYLLMDVAKRSCRAHKPFSDCCGCHKEPTM